jgi:hypothetical protein
MVVGFGLIFPIRYILQQLPPSARKRFNPSLTGIKNLLIMPEVL